MRRRNADELPHREARSCSLLGGDLRFVFPGEQRPHHSAGRWHRPRRHKTSQYSEEGACLQAVRLRSVVVGGLVQGEHDKEGDHLVHAALKVKIAALPSQLEERHLLFGNLRLWNHLRIPSLPQEKDRQLQGIFACAWISYTQAYSFADEENRLIFHAPLKLPQVPIADDRPKPEDQSYVSRSQAVPPYNWALQVHVSSSGTGRG